MGCSVGVNSRFLAKRFPEVSALLLETSSVEARSYCGWVARMMLVPAAVQRWRPCVQICCWHIVGGDLTDAKLACCRRQWSAWT